MPSKTLDEQKQSELNRTATKEEMEWSLLVMRSFEAGNFANAYTSEDLDTAWKHTREIEKFNNEINNLNYHAFVMGFYSSYEISEIPIGYKETYLTAYHSDAGKECIKSGYCDPRD